MHVTDPARFPVSSNAAYQPHSATLDQALNNARRLGLPSLVFVQPSTYGTDNSCLLDGLKQLGPQRARGVVVCDPDATSDAMLDEWHARGVRGVRLNLKSVGREMSTEELQQMVQQYVELIKGRHWAVQLYADLQSLPALLPLVDQNRDTKFVVDHLGSPPDIRRDMDEVPGWRTLLELMRYENFFVKVSGPYRLTKDRSYAPLEGAGKALYEMRDGKGVVFASDWPHTRFEGTDVKPWVERCLEWCDGDEGLAERLFRGSAEVLWDVNAPELSS